MSDSVYEQIIAELRDEKRSLPLNVILDGRDSEPAPTRLISATPVDTAARPTEAAAPAWYSIRPATPAELPGVYEAWAGTWKRSRSAGCIPNHLFNEVTFTAITQLLQRGMKVAVLVADAAPELVLAWVAYEADARSDQMIVHYLFTKDGFRQRGLAKTLLAHIGAGEKFIYTHQTGFAKYWPQAYHNPGIARRKSL